MLQILLIFFNNLIFFSGLLSLAHIKKACGDNNGFRIGLEWFAGFEQWAL